MPYITEERRDALAIDGRMECAGELNYAITELIVQYLEDHGLNYQTCNDIAGAMDNAKSEFKRRVQDPYEDTKIEANGDIGYERFVTTA